jgi:actin-related protein 6
VDVGGKLLTNYLKEVVSFRQWNMMDEFKLIDQVKEELCYVSTHLQLELEQTKVMKKNVRRPVDTKDPFSLPLKRNFVLPDFVSINRGYTKPHNEPVRDSEQVNYLT